MKALFDAKTWPFWQDLLDQEPDLEVFIVGGAVRDTLLGLPVKDFDFIARGIPLERLISLLEPLGKVDLVGKRFGVIKFRPNTTKEQFDIALPRTERSLSFTGAYRDFDIQSDHTLAIDQDLARRDFTINAMAYNLRTDELIDPFFGKKDLDAKIIRTVGSAVTRFQEDYSRMLRAIRFSCKLDFALTEKIQQTIKKLGQHINDKINDEWIVSREILSQEFLKALDANPVHCLNLLDELNLLQSIFPEVFALKECKQSPPYHLEGSVYNHILSSFKATKSDHYKNYFPKPIPVLSKLGILFHDIGKPQTSSTDKEGKIHFYGHAKVGAEMTTSICSRLHLGGTEYASFKCKDLAWIVKHHLFSIHNNNSPVKLVKLEELFFSDRYPSESLLHIILADLLGSKPEEPIDRLAPFEHLWQQLQEMAPNGTLPTPLLTGDDLISELQFKQGPPIQQALEKVREAQLQKIVTTKQEAIDLLKNT